MEAEWAAVRAAVANVATVSTYRVRSVSTPAIRVGRSTDNARASRSMLTIPTLRVPAFDVA